jgi:hypothetical protein
MENRGRASPGRRLVDAEPVLVRESMASRRPGGMVIHQLGCFSRRLPQLGERSAALA